MTEAESKLSQRLIYLYPLFISLFFLAAAPIAVVYTEEWDFLQNLGRILVSPSKLVTDYFALGGLGSTLFNAAVCGLCTNFVVYLSRAKANATILAGYMLVVAHCFYGLNFLNMWPPFIGIILYCIVRKKRIGDNIHIAFFSTALAPFVSELCFRYAIENYSSTTFNINWVGVGLSLVCGLAIGFVVPALLPGTAAMHHGYSLYKAGLAIGILGIFVYCFMYKTLGVTPHNTGFDSSSFYEKFGNTYYIFMNVFFAVIFLIALVLGFLRNGRSFRNYRKLTSCSGYGLDFADKFGMPLCLINFGVYGFCILLYLNIIFWLPTVFPFLPEGVGFTGPTVGVTFAALTFSADGQHPKNVAPIALGYTILFALVCSVCLITGADIPWTLSTQAYINGLAFATGLCPIAGSYGFKYGVISGLVSAIICTSTAAMHGGFVLYNGGFNAGLAAIILIPIFDFYKIKPKNIDDDTIVPIKHFKGFLVN